MAEITDDELAQLREAARERDELRRDAQAASEQPSEPARPHLVAHRALLADGSVHDYAGAHPTHVSRTGPDGREQLVPVLAVYPA